MTAGSLPTRTPTASGDGACKSAKRTDGDEGPKGPEGPTPNDAVLRSPSYPAYATHAPQRDLLRCTRAIARAIVGERSFRSLGSFRETRRKWRKDAALRNNPPRKVRQSALA